MSVLSTELSTDPLGRYAGLTAQQKADSLNALDRTVPETLDSFAFSLHIVENGLYSKAYDGSINGALADNVRSACFFVIDIVRSDELDYIPSKHQTIIERMDSGGGNAPWTTGQVNGLIAAAEGVVSRAEELRRANLVENGGAGEELGYGRRVGVGDVVNAGG